MPPIFRGGCIIYLSDCLQIHYCRAVRADIKPERKLNNIVWARCPKRVPCCINSLQIFVCEAVTTSRAIPENKKRSVGGEGLRTCYFQGDWKNRICRLQESIKKELEFPVMIKKKIVWNFHRSWFLALEISMGVIRFGGNSRGETSFCLEFPRVKWQI